jgi:rare lipoprotein A (peptidoglycan hydrolase)
MSTWRELLTVAWLSASIGLSFSSERAMAQSFDDRWSIIPKANAEPSPPASDPQPDAEERPGPDATTNGQSEVKQTDPAAAPGAGKTVRTISPKVFTGVASYYAYAGGKTASGAPYRRDALTAAHRTLPFGTRVRVTAVKTKKSVEVVITDRGPALRSRVLDLSLAAGQVLGMPGRGVIQVRGEVIGGGAPILGKGS